MPTSVYTMQGGSLLEMMSPPFRSVEYNAELGIDNAMRVVTVSMRAAFRIRPHTIAALPPSSQDPGSPPEFNLSSFNLADPQSFEEAKATLRVFIGAYLKLTPEERAQLPRASDLTSPGEELDIHTLWRSAVYELLFHVFVDCLSFLGESGGEARYGHFHPPPAHEIFVVADGVNEVKSWDRHVMMLPAYLADGVVLKLMRVQEKRQTPMSGNEADGEAGSHGEHREAETETTEVEQGRFEEEQPYRTWWIKRGEKVRVLFERKGEIGGELGGPVAVMLVGLTCDQGVTMNEEEEIEYLGLPRVGPSPDTQSPSSDT